MDEKWIGTVMTYFKFLDFSKVAGIANRTVGMLQWGNISSWMASPDNMFQNRKEIKIC